MPKIPLQSENKNKSANPESGHSPHSVVPIDIFRTISQSCVTAEAENEENAEIINVESRSTLSSSVNAFSYSDKVSNGDVYSVRTGCSSTIESGYSDGRDNSSISGSYDSYYSYYSEGVHESEEHEQSTIDYNFYDYGAWEGVDDPIECLDFGGSLEDEEKINNRNITAEDSSLITEAVSDMNRITSNSAISQTSTGSCNSCGDEGEAGEETGEDADRLDDEDNDDNHILIIPPSSQKQLEEPTSTSNEDDDHDINIVGPSFQKRLPAPPERRYFPKNCQNFRARLFRSQINNAITRCYQHYSNEREDQVIKELSALRLARIHYVYNKDTKALLFLLKRYVYVFTLLISPICPHWAEFVWDRVMHKICSVRRAIWPLAGIVEDDILCANEYVNKAIHHIKLEVGKIQKEKGVKNESLTVVMYVTDYYTMKQKRILDLMNKEWDEIRQDFSVNVVKKALEEFSRELVNNEEEVDNSDGDFFKFFEGSKPSYVKNKKKTQKKKMKGNGLKSNILEDVVKYIISTKLKEIKSSTFFFHDKKFSSQLHYLPSSVLSMNIEFLYAATGVKHIFILTPDTDLNKLDEYSNLLDHTIGELSLGPPPEILTVGSLEMEPISKWLRRKFPISGLRREYLLPGYPFLRVFPNMNETYLQKLQWFRKKIFHKIG
jgi:hypothetical protein